MDEQQQQAVDATPEEQAQYDDLVTRAMELMYSDQTHDMVVERMRAMKDKPALMIGTLAANLARKAVEDIRAEGGQVEDEILAYAGFEIVAELIELAQAAGIVPKSEDDEPLGKGAMYVAIRAYAEMADKAGEVTDEDRAASKQMLEQMKAQTNESTVA